MERVGSDDTVIRKCVTPGLAWTNHFFLGAPASTEQKLDEGKDLVIHGGCEEFFCEHYARMRAELEMQLRSRW